MSERTTPSCARHQHQRACDMLRNDSQTQTRVYPIKTRGKLSFGFSQCSVSSAAIGAGREHLIKCLSERKWRKFFSQDLLRKFPCLRNIDGHGKSSPARTSGQASPVSSLLLSTADQQSVDDKQRRKEKPAFRSDRSSKALPPARFSENSFLFEIQPSSAYHRLCVALRHYSRFWLVFRIFVRLRVLFS